ncbi:MAG: 23S rRNA (guanosine(2251)-2'-O)-methyltransferase RlmB [Proteobacteria bacterium]|nr:23S rRNA (guanosine(2251)-2'-O)-methyltransferase RlmB [Pseudomonadota bacterium]
MDQVEGRNPVIEALQRKKRRVIKVMMDRGAKPDRRVLRIKELCDEGGVRFEVVDRRRLDEMAKGRVHNGVIALAEPLPTQTTKGLINDLFDAGQEPFLILADAIQYEHNLGAILRSGLGFGVNGVIIPTRRGTAVSPVVQRVAMGAAEEIPVVRESMHSALKHIKKAGIRVIGADMGGKPAHELNMGGPLAIVMGSEGRGLSSSLRDRCDEIVSIPLAGGLESLNVSVAAAIMMYERFRQSI